MINDLAGPGGGGLNLIALMLLSQTVTVTCDVWCVVIDCMTLLPSSKKTKIERRDNAGPGPSRQ
jgi:hypothetical protein